ncbi:MAG: hypothetical protein NWS66_02580 [Saprospiraceae bacterium]|nr:hypothetical protein [Saprospiraceae bacterium]MDP4698805.1 hypothetical protein [Saprospiraceae bacterium]MDP4814640.1 hypothetical protein [Saprospiraceae bacterium]MDP4912876.1 hypothetical protein [Saprospiraceae bacterium]MDP5049402.1 hypothetical protein [Saprospiraceae bacterium]
MQKDQFFRSGLLKKYLLGIATPIECAKIAALLELNPDWKNQVELLENKFKHWVKLQNSTFTKKNQLN